MMKISHRKVGHNWKFIGNNEKDTAGWNTDWTDIHGFEIRVLCHIAVLFHTSTPGTQSIRPL
ncbi:MAG TPA: hypothetical protein VIO58_02500 [Candidatus Methanoperedens sp.]